MNIEIIFLGLGIDNCYQASVLVYDENNNLIYKKRTYDGKLCLLLKNKHVYRIVASSIDEVIDTPLYIDNKCKYVLSFSRNFIDINSVTLILTDYYYNNLPIEKGELILCQR